MTAAVSGAPVVACQALTYLPFACACSAIRPLPASTTVNFSQVSTTDATACSGAVPSSCFLALTNSPFDAFSDTVEPIGAGLPAASGWANT